MEVFNYFAVTKSVYPASTWVNGPLTSFTIFQIFVSGDCAGKCGETQNVHLNTFVYPRENAGKWHFDSKSLVSGKFIPRERG